MKLCDHRYKSARYALKFELLLILLAVRFTTFWHRHRIMTHFCPHAVLCPYLCLVTFKLVLHSYSEPSLCTGCNHLAKNLSKFPATNFGFFSVLVKNCFF